VADRTYWLFSDPVGPGPYAVFCKWAFENTSTLGGIRQERCWDPRAPALKTDGRKRPEPLVVDLGPTAIAKE
jgi:hypothetical protein